MSLGQRLGLGDVERDAGEPPVRERAGHRLEVDEAAARGVEEHRRPPHQRDRLVADEVTVLGAHRRVQRDEVRLGQRVGQRRGELDARERRLGHVRVVGDDAKAERECTFRDSGADAPDTDEGELSAAQ